ncbi:uncharacterized protein AKAW2_11601S [Aspergillus luchuensis]|uniref:Uncharacterized protein n=1 Tax=Aspergillus kawachii TaxID=1069201 RepID=A0A7R8A5M3_ASPKA|nr:uncharacterized protein AKAW2_11601S [Aspergillus luchuensis]BCR94555.1 hypothetical protein AKAW2_11601S [Aspergillus luchuensis]BCS07149.1 hypothetical protein ALUC_11530S [Aspergillus luchuensis]
MSIEGLENGHHDFDPNPSNSARPFTGVAASESGRLAFHFLTLSIGIVAGDSERLCPMTATDAYMRHPTKISSTASLYDSLYDASKAAYPKMTRNKMASYIAVECDNHLSVSHLSLGTLLAYTIYEPSRHPDCQRALQQELQTLAEPSDQSLAHRLADLPVLDAVVTETMRTRAPCPGPFPRVIAELWLPACREIRCPRRHHRQLLCLGPSLQPGTLFIPGGMTLRYIAQGRRQHSHGDAEVGLDLWKRRAVIKELLATVYTAYETYLDDGFTGNVEQVDAFSAGPIAGGLQLKFRVLT